MLSSLQNSSGHPEWQFLFPADIAVFSGFLSWKDYSSLQPPDRTSVSLEKYINLKPSDHTSLTHILESPDKSLSSPPL